MVHLTRWDPFRELDEMAAQMHRAMNSAMTGAAESKTMAVPLSDVFEEDGKLIVHMHIAGLTEDELEIDVEGGVLTVKGERVVSDKEKEARSYIMRESSTSVFRRMVLPKRADAAKVAAHLHDGILRIEIPLKPEAKPKKITVKAKKTVKK